MPFRRTGPPSTAENLFHLGEIVQSLFHQGEAAIQPIDLNVLGLEAGSGWRFPLAKLLQQLRFKIEGHSLCDLKRILLDRLTLFRQCNLQFLQPNRLITHCMCRRFLGA